MQGIASRVTAREGATDEAPMLWGLERGRFGASLLDAPRED